MKYINTACVFKSHKFIYPTTQIKRQRKKYSFLVLSGSVFLVSLHSGREERAFQSVLVSSSLFLGFSQGLMVLQCHGQASVSCDAAQTLTLSHFLIHPCWLGSFACNILPEAVFLLWRCFWLSTWPPALLPQTGTKFLVFSLPFRAVQTFKLCLSVEEFQNAFLFQQSLTKRLCRDGLHKT